MESFFPNVEGTQGEWARERVLKDLRTLAADAEMLLYATIGDVSEKAREARERLEAGLARAKATITELQEKGEEVARRADATIRVHPYESVGVALGVGVLLGLWLGRR